MLSSKIKMNVEKGICPIAAPIFAVSCCHTAGFCGNSTNILELTIDGLPANVSIGNVPLFCSPSLAKEVPVPITRGTVCLSWRRTIMNSLKRISRRTKSRKLNTKQTLSCNPGAFHFSNGKRLSRLSMEEELGITSG